MTGQNTKERTTLADKKQIYYYYGGERNNDSFDSWKEAEMMLVESGCASQIHNFALLFISLSVIKVSVEIS